MDSLVRTVRKLAKQSARAVFLRSGIAALVRCAFVRRRVTILIYHEPDPDTLRRHLTYLARHYHFITLDAVGRALTEKRWDELPDYPLVITIDDGHASNRALADLFREFGVRPTIFLCSAITGTDRPFWWKTKAAETLDIEGLKLLPDRERRARLEAAGAGERVEGPPQALSWDEVLNMATVADFGAHTRTHPVLIRCDDASCAEEITLCRPELEAGMGLPCRHFAYPNGDYGEREIALVRGAGFVTARTTDPGWNGPDADPMRLKGIVIPDNAVVPWLAAKLTLPISLPRLRKDRQEEGETPPCAPVGIGVRQRT
ncbi:polysaccharide deacetylase family protein [Azospirillum sp. sgz302134]